jgi:hypothetical protein
MRSVNTITHQNLTLIQEQKSWAISMQAILIA